MFTGFINITLIQYLHILGTGLQRLGKKCSEKTESSEGSGKKQMNCGIFANSIKITEH